MKSADIKTDVKQEIKKLVAVLWLCTGVLSQNLKTYVKQTCIFHLILVGIPCSLTLPIKNGEDEEGGEWEGFYLTTKIC